ncbi:hypothetical protein [Burkholderia gladioli]|uniref:hypothetical protein n=1 Tax=Burkholderia gladioli TaxID=28095 RepID=UPI001640BE6E|nr:hypothetical protein [Burkholderia gladioli]
MTDPNTTTLAEAFDLLREIAARKRYDPNAKVPWTNNSGSITINLKRELLARVDALLDAAAAAPVAEPAPDPLRRRVERLLVELHAEGRLSEGQCVRVLDIPREDWRELAEFLSSATQAVAADGAPADEPSEVEQVIACLGDDAAKLREANPNDEMADNMDAAARLLSERAAIVQHCAKIADSFTCGSCGLDGKVGAAIRASNGAASKSSAGASESTGSLAFDYAHKLIAQRLGGSVKSQGAPADAAKTAAPSGYAYRYPAGNGTVIRFNDGREVNGSRPIESVPYWLGAPPAASVAAEEVPSFESPLTHYGMLVRALRIVTGTLLADMAKAMNVSPAFLSALELGRRPVTHDNAVFTSGFFSDHGVIGTLPALTYAAAVTRLAQGTDLPDSEGGEA